MNFLQTRLTPAPILPSPFTLPSCESSPTYTRTHSNTLPPSYTRARTHGNIFLPPPPPGNAPLSRQRFVILRQTALPPRLSFDSVFVFVFIFGSVFDVAGAYLKLEKLHDYIQWLVMSMFN